jgi:hypothetical protein
MGQSPQAPLLNSSAASPRWGLGELRQSGKQAPPPTASPPNMEASRMVVHEDGGVRLARAGDNNDTPEAWIEPVHELPPMYRDYDTVPPNSHGVSRS